MSDSNSLLTLEPIGYVRTGSARKFDAPHQPSADAPETNRIELLPGKQFELALMDLASFDRIWLLWWFHKNPGWRPKVLPPRGPAKRRGVFATRSPHRPNPLGLTNVALLEVVETTLIVGPLDLLDGTPIFDIKPYLRTVDAHPDASLGWLESVEAEEQAPPSHTVAVSDQARAELDYLKTEWQIDFATRAFELLSRNPNPHRTRRILEVEPGLFRMACGAWRMYFSVFGSLVTVLEIKKGYADDRLAGPDSGRIVDRDAQVAFALWKGGQ